MRDAASERDSRRKSRASRDYTGWGKQLLRSFFLGSIGRGSIFAKIVVYVILTGLGFVFIYPLIYMISTSMMDTKDLVDSTVSWIPTRLSFESFIKAARTLDVWKGIKDSLRMTVIPAVLQTAVLACAGYGLGRFPVPLKKVWIVLSVLMFLIPAQVTMIPRFLLFNSYKLVGTIWPVYVISLLGQGIKSSIFLLIYYNFFATYPKALDEAARIDGAGRFRVFSQIALPMAKPAIVVCFLFSFIWIWNDTTQIPQYSTGAATTLPMLLQQFADRFNKLYSSASVSTGGALNESIRLAGTLLSILPLITLYLILQKQFVESIEKTGITGE
ncbi:multiple sugar transport system permease protein [Anaerotaenia torta]|uniref:carbohydrate ABC transporter permease n=1 Tax=Anaerotaenia torta TaxID=433293 RepID=UPI003D21D08E